MMANRRRLKRTPDQLAAAAEALASEPEAERDDPKELAMLAAENADLDKEARELAKDKRRSRRRSAATGISWGGIGGGGGGGGGDGMDDVHAMLADAKRQVDDEQSEAEEGMVPLRRGRGGGGGGFPPTASGGEPEFGGGEPPAGYEWVEERGDGDAGAAGAGPKIPWGPQGMDEEEEEEEELARLAEEKARQRRIELLKEINHEEALGAAFPKKFTARSNEDEMVAALEAARYQRKLKTTAKLLRQGMMLVINIFEKLNGKLHPFGEWFDIDGWSAGVMRNIADYDAVILEICELHGGNMPLLGNPYVRLVGMLGMSCGAYAMQRNAKRTADRRQQESQRRAPFATAQQIISQQPDVARTIHSELSAREAANAGYAGPPQPPREAPPQPQPRPPPPPPPRRSPFPSLPAKPKPGPGPALGPFAKPRPAPPPPPPRPPSPVQVPIGANEPDQTEAFAMREGWTRPPSTSSSSPPPPSFPDLAARLREPESPAARPSISEALVGLLPSSGTMSGTAPSADEDRLMTARALGDAVAQVVAASAGPSSVEPVPPFPLPATSSADQSEVGTAAIPMRRKGGRGGRKVGTVMAL